VSYYRGDYYRGDYYRGDIGSFFKKAARAVGGAVAGFVTGGPVGAVTGALGSLGRAGGSSATAPITYPAATQPFVGPAIRIGSKIIPPLLAGKEAVDLIKGLNPFGGSNGKRRTMNHLNPKALSRATRRVEGFVKKARKAVSPLGYTVVRRGGGRCAPKRKCR